MKSLAFICGGRLVPASRFRVEPVASELAQRGWTPRIIYGYGALDQRIENRPLRSAYRALCRGKRAARTATLSHDGPVMVQRLAWPWAAAPEVNLARRNERLVFDFDDAVFLNHQGEQSGSRLSALRKVFRAARHVVAGNSWLAECVPDGCDVSVIPTCIDTSQYTPGGKRKFNAVPRIGWIGTGGNQRYLEQIVEDLKQLRHGGQEFELVVCSDERPASALAQLAPTFVKWDPATEVDTLRSFDIGLMPLWDDDWCRGKCSFKAIQYMAVGVPVIASAVGFNKDVIRNEMDGFLVENSGWKEALAALLKDSDLRYRMGSEARSRAVSSYDIARAINEYEVVFNKVMSTG